MHEVSTRPRLLTARRGAALLLPLLLASCSDGASLTDAGTPPAAAAAGTGARPASAKPEPAGATAPQATSVTGDFMVEDRDLTFRVSGAALGDNPAGMGLYLDRPGGIGPRAMGMTLRQDGRNLWGLGLDQDTEDPYVDFVSVFQTTRGDIFRFREGGRAILGNGIGRPEPGHVLTLVDRENGYIDNILNLSRTSGGHSTRYVRAFDGTTTAFAVGEGGRVGVGKDYSGDFMLDVAGEAKARSFRSLADGRVMSDAAWVESSAALRFLQPLRFTYAFGPEGTDGPRYGLDGREVEQVFPELVRTEGPDELHTVDYAQLTVLLLHAVQELEHRVECLERKLASASGVPAAADPSGTSVMPPEGFSASVRTRACP